MPCALCLPGVSRKEQRQYEAAGYKRRTCLIFKQVHQFAEVIGVYTSRAAVVFIGYIGGKAYYFSHHTTGAHYAGTAKRHVRGADIPSCHKQVADIFQNTNNGTE